MNVKKTVKKIVALGAGAGLVGATLMGALAQDLSQYPDMVLDDGQFDGKLVIGAEAKTADMIGAVDIAASLQAASTTDVAVDGSTTVDLEGDARKIAESGDILELGENIDDVVETLTDDDLAMLAEGEVTTEKGTTDFTQTLELTGIPTGSGVVKLAENRDDVVDYFLYWADGAQIFNYELEFTSGLESDIDSDNKLEDLEDETIVIMGQEYSVVSATTNAGRTSVTLDLIAGDETDTLQEGETQTYTVNGVDYEVTVLIIGSNSEVKFLIDGEVTDSLTAGETDTVAGLEIGVREVVSTTAYRESDPSSIVEFYLGANKIVLADTNVSDDATGGSVEIDKENIEDADVQISAVEVGGDMRINRITYSLDADKEGSGDIYIAEGEGIRQYLDESEGLFNSMWDIQFVGLTEPTADEISFQASGDDEYTLSFTNRRGQEYVVPYAFASASTVKFGEETDDLIFWENDADANSSTAGAAATGDYNIGLDDYFVVTDVGSNSTADNADDTYVLQFTDVNTDDKIVTFENVATGSEIKATYTGTISQSAASPVAGDITIGGKNFGFWLYDADAAATTQYELAVDLNDNGFLDDGAVVDIVTKNGGILTLAAEAEDVPSITNNNWTSTLLTLGEDVDNDQAQEVQIVFTRTAAELDLDVTATALQGTLFQESPRNEDRTVSVNRYGTWFDETDETDEADSLTISYPSEQVEALVYVVGGETTQQRRTSGTTAQQVNLLSVGLASLDEDIDVDDANLIVVGGPCVNTVAADLLGNPSDCTEGFNPGTAMIRAFDTGDNVAVLVAGYDAEDTVRASQVLADAATGSLPADLAADFEGESLVVVTADSRNIEIRAAAEADMDADEDADETAE